MMKNVNEPDRKTIEEIRTGDFASKLATRSDAEVLPFERRTASESERTLLPKRQIEELRSRWSIIQNNFVDEPRKTVEDADKLVGSAIQQIEEGLVAERSSLQKRLSRGDDISTEDLRMCLQNYRALFFRLVAL
jgi:hypothetical protein